jgi:hypothetical protein
VRFLLWLKRNNTLAIIVTAIFIAQATSLAMSQNIALYWVMHSILPTQDENTASHHMSESVRFVIKIKDPEFETRSAASPPSMHHCPNCPGVEMSHTGAEVSSIRLQVYMSLNISYISWPESTTTSLLSYFWFEQSITYNMVVVFIRKNCIRMVFVYFAFWGLQEEFSTLPRSPCFLHNFGCCFQI